MWVVLNLIIRLLPSINFLIFLSSFLLSVFFLFYIFLIFSTLFHKRLPCKHASTKTQPNAIQKQNNNNKKKKKKNSSFSIVSCYFFSLSPLHDSSFSLSSSFIDYRNFHLRLSARFGLIVPIFRLF